MPNMTMRTKIICTLGPACDHEDVLRAMVQAGMCVARLNFSHGSHAEHQQRIARLRKVAAEVGANIALMGDLQGPKFRIGHLRDEPIQLAHGQRVVLSARPDAQAIPLPHPDLLAALQIGQRVLLDDGALVLRVVARPDPVTVACEVMVGGQLSSHKGITAPGLALAGASLTPKDREDVQFAIAQGLDALAVSFVRNAGDIHALRQLAHDLGGDPLIVAKIEKPEALADLPAIVRASDAVMVARGDLGVESAPEEVPFYQKRIILACLRAGKPVITATQMLQSMIHAPQPTRAEASDVANAVLDGSDALMLSGETAIGKFPLEAVQAMARIAAHAEASAIYQPEKLLAAARDVLASDLATPTDRQTDAITTAAAHIAASIGAKAIVCASASGFTARMVSRHRPSVPIVCLTPHQRTQRYTAFMWGVQTVLTETRRSDSESLFNAACQAARQLGYVGSGDQIVVTAGLPLGSGSGHTNVIRVMQVS